MKKTKKFTISQGLNTLSNLQIDKATKSAGLSESKEKKQVKDVGKAEKKTWVRRKKKVECNQYPLRIPVTLDVKVEQFLEQSYISSKNAFIVEAIREKLNKEE